MFSLISYSPQSRGIPRSKFKSTMLKSRPVDTRTGIVTTVQPFLSRFKEFSKPTLKRECWLRQRRATCTRSRLPNSTGGTIHTLSLLISVSDSASRRQTGNTLRMLFSPGKVRPKGHVVDQVVLLKRGGADTPSNMQWKTKAGANAKDKVE